MKTKYLAISLLIGMFLFNGCSDSNIDNYGVDFTEPSAIVTNPFKPDKLDLPSNADYISYGISVNIPNFEFLTYENNRVTLPITVENIGKEFKLGFCIFSDGIIQEYTSNISDEKTIMQTFDLTTDSIQTIDFYIENVENISDNDDISFSFITMKNPEVIPMLDNVGDALPHNISGGDSLHLHMNTPSESGKYKIYDQFDIQTITEDEAERFSILLDERDTSLSTKFILNPTNESGRPRENVIAASEDGKLELNLYGWTTNGDDSFSANGTYRVSFYKNHKRIKFNDNFDYMDIELKENSITTANVLLEDINEGDFIYCIAVPINNFKLKVKKSITAAIINPNDMPPVEESQLFLPVFVEHESIESNNNDWIAIEDDEIEQFLNNNSR